MHRALLVALSFTAFVAVTPAQSTSSLPQRTAPPTQTPKPKTTPAPEPAAAPKQTPPPKTTPAPKQTPPPATPAPKQTPAQTSTPKSKPKETPPPATASSTQQAKPRPPEPQRQGASGQRGSGQQVGQAKPRPPAPSRPPLPPPREVPPQYFGPRHYYFPPASLHRGFYYHPYFGFYFGPYYGPFYPYQGPWIALAHDTSAVRLKVKPAETQVYVDGYYAGEVDDFDGIFQRLYLPTGPHQLDFYLSGYRTFRLDVYFSPGDQRDIVHQMQRLRAGERSQPPLAPRSMHDDRLGGAAALPGGQPVSPFGVLTLRVDPTDAEIVIDDEVWLMTEDQTELVIHVPAGPHRLEVRKDGYQVFRTQIELAEGSRTRLSVRLVR